MVLWTPANLTTAPRLWLDGGDATFNGSNQLTAMPFKGANGGAAASINGPPTKATLNGLNGIMFDAVGETVQKAMPAWGTSGWMTVVCVWVPNTGALALDGGPFHSGHGINPTGTATFHTSSSAAGEGLWFAPNSYAGSPMMLSGDETWAENVGHVAVAAAGSSVALWVDGTTVSLVDSRTGSVPSLTARNWIFGEDFGAEPLYGGLFQLLLLDYAPTTAERQQLEGWAAHKYGLTASLPADHPYKSAAPEIPPQSLGPSGFAGTASFGSPGLQLSVAATGFSGTGAFGAPKLNLSVRPSGFAGTAAFGSPTLSLAQSTISPAGFSGSANFGTPRLNLNIRPSGFAGAAAFGESELRQQVWPAGFVGSASFGTPALVEPGVIQTITAAGFSGSGSFGAPTFIIRGWDAAEPPTGLWVTAAEPADGWIAEAPLTGAWV